MQMGRLVRWPHLVDVEVDRSIEGAQRGEPRLLGGLTQRGGRHGGFAVGVPTRLQPLLELRVEEHEHSPTSLLHHDRRTGEVPLETGSMEGVGMGRGEVEHLVAHRALHVIGRLDGAQDGDEIGEVGRWRQLRRAGGEEFGRDGCHPRWRRIDASSAPSNAANWTATGSGPAPPAVVRRSTETPRSSRKSASGPSSGEASTSSRRGTP